MDASQFDRLARLLGATTERRTWISAALGFLLVPLALSEDVLARRKQGRRAQRSNHHQPRPNIAAARKKKRKKCKPKCVGKACGPNGCKGKRAGVCGTCAAPTVCNDAGQCVGCRTDGECTVQVCNSASCQNETCVLAPVNSDPACASPLRCVAGQCVGCGSATDCAARICNAATCQGGACTYLPVSSDPVCMPPQRCIAGACIGCRSAGDCALRACNSVSCENDTCVYTPEGNGGSCGGVDDICCGGVCINRASDEAHCGACGNACTGGDTCQNGVCCTVCASGCPFTTINDALNEAAAGATVRLCPGTYVERVFIVQDLTLVGMGSSPGDTVISNAQGTIVSLESGPEGLGGDVTATMRNLRVTGTLVSSLYGAMSVSPEVDLTLERVEITGNSVSQSGASTGGAIVNGGKVTLIDSFVSQNNSKFGGGIYGLLGSTLTLTRSFVESNIATQGGGVWNQGTLNLNEDSRIRFNQSGGVGSGGGVYNTGGTVVINSGSIQGNTAGGNPDNCINVNGGTGCPA